MTTTGASAAEQQDRPARRPTSRGSSSRVGDVLVVLAFLVVHATLWVLNVLAPNLPLGDVTVTYSRWMGSGQASGHWVGVDSAWVYPVVALLPMMLAAAAGPAHEGTGWLVLMALLDALAVVSLWRYRVGRVRVVWWWLAFLLLLGPIALGRIDTVAVALGVVGVAFVARRPGVASALFTLGAWIKVWPAALVGVLLLLRRGHRRAVLSGAFVLTGVVVAIDLVLGGGAFLFSFVGQQTGRGLQIEAPFATAFLWRAWAHVPGTYVYYDQQILTFQVTGTGTHLAATLSTPLMALVVGAVVLLAVRAVLDGVRRVELAPVVALALTTALIVTNKVGSPQYIAWLAVPVLWGLTAGARSAQRFRGPAVVALACAFATQLVYPYTYDRLLVVAPMQVAVLSVRNALEVTLLVWAVVDLVRISREGRHTSATSLRRVAGRPAQSARRPVAVPGSVAVPASAAGSASAPSTAERPRLAAGPTEGPITGTTRRQ